MTYHINEIPKGKLGQLSKIQEELSEAIDAEEQGCKIMLLLELSDMIGAVDMYLRTNHPNISVEDLITMSNITERAFNTGARK